MPSRQDSREASVAAHIKSYRKEYSRAGRTAFRCIQSGVGSSNVCLAPQDLHAWCKVSGLFGIEPLMPAYGRDYKSKAALLADFNANKDFATPSGAYTNKADLLQMGIVEISARYKKLTELIIVKVAP